MQLRNLLLSNTAVVADHVLDICTPHAEDEQAGIY